MNEATRKRAVEVMADALMNDEQASFHGTASDMLNALLAAGIHVAEWRDVGEAKDGDEMLLWCGGMDCQVGIWDGAHFETLDGFMLTDGATPTHCMDLPEPPKTSPRGG